MSYHIHPFGLVLILNKMFSARIPLNPHLLFPLKSFGSGTFLQVKAKENGHLYEIL